MERKSELIKLVGYIADNALDWHKSQNTKVEKRYEDKKYVAGEYGEEFTKSLITHRNFGTSRNCHCFKDKRIPILNGNGKREIDFIVVTQRKIHIIEVKNWAGQLYGKPDDKIWHFCSAGGEQRTVQNIVLDNEIKSKVFLSFFNHLGYDITADDIDHRVFFIDTRRKDGSIRLRMDKELELCPHVVTSDKLKHYLEVEQADNTHDYEALQSLLLEFIELLIKFVVEEEISIPVRTDNSYVGKEKHSELIADINKLPTWDQVIYYGGKTIRGDLMGLYNTNSVKELVKRRIDFNPNKICEIENTDVKREKKNEESKLNKFLSIAKGLALGGMLLDIKSIDEEQDNHVRGNPYFKFKFRPAGSPDDITIEIMDVIKIIFGNREANTDWLYNRV